MTTYTTTDTELTSIANAIRTKGGTTELLTYPDDFIVAIGQIEAGGGGNVYQDENGYIVLDDEASEGMITAIPLSVTANGTYTAAEHVAYTPVTVNVAPTLQTKTKNYTPSTTSQSETIIADTGYDGLSSVDITVSAMPAGTAGTPSAAKGTVSNHAVTITPTVTNTTGYITGGTKNGTAISVSAGELVSGTYTVDAGGTADVTNYASISVTAMTLPTTTSSTSSGTLKATFAAPTSDKYLNIPVGYNSTASYYKLSAVTGITLPTSLATTSTGTSKATLVPHATAARYLNIPTGYNATASFYTISAPTAMTLPTTTATTSTGTLKATFAAPTSDKYLNIPTGYNATASYYKLSAVTAMTVPTTTAASGSGTLKLTVTPNTSTQYINIPTGYNSSAVNYKINPIPSDYIVPTGTYTVSASGTHDVTEYATASVAAGSVSVPTISVNGSGLITATTTGSAGYISATTTSGTLQLTTQSGKTITPSTSAQTAVSSGRYTTGTITVAAIPSNYIVPTGTYNVTSSGIKDVTSYASISVPTGSTTVPSGITSATYTMTWLPQQASMLFTTTLSVTPVVTAGYISSGTAGNMTVTISTTISPITFPTAAATTSNSGTLKATIVPTNSVQYINIPAGLSNIDVTYQINAIEDYVIAQGTETVTSGSSTWTWTYRKWNSGISECWCDTATSSRTTNTAWGNIYYSTTTIGGMPYPSAMFTATPSATLDFIPTSNDAWSNITADGTKDNAPTAYVYRPNNGTVTGFCRCYARGKWN